MEASVGPVTLQGPGWVANFAFRSMHIHEALSASFRFVLELLSDDPKQDPKAILGQQLSVCLDLGDAGTRYFNGYVTEFSSRGALGEHFVYGLVVRPWLWLLSRTTNCRVFQKKSVPDIVKQLFRLQGFTDFSELLTGSYEPREYVVQYRETDQHFISRLLEDEGIYYFYKHEADKHTLVLCDSPSSHDPTPFYEALPYFPPSQGRQEHLDHVERWEIISAVESGAYVLKEFDFEKPKAPLQAKKDVDPGHEQGSFELFDFPGGYKKDALGATRAKTRLEEARATWISHHGEGNAPGLSVGALFTLSEFPVEEHNHDYLVLSLEATLRSHALESGDANAGDLYTCRIVAIDSNQQYRPPRVTSRPTVHGVQSAIVVGKAGEEIWTDEYGRVKIKFPWDRYVPSDEENASCWVRVAQLWAGSGFGAMHLPRIGQEVLVEFMEGDPDQPMVTGRVYNADNKPPYDLPKNQTQSGIKSRSTKGATPENFNELRFEDKKGEEEMFLQAERNQTTNVKKDRSASVGGSDSVAVTGDRSVTVHGNLSVTVEGTGKSPVHHKVDVTGKHQFDASDTIEIQAPTHIKLTVGESSVEITPTAITLTAGKASIKIDGAVLAKSKEDISQLLLNANAKLSSSANVLLEGSKVAGTAELEASLGVEPHSVKITPASIDLGGTNVNVNGSALVTVGGALIQIG